MINDIQKIKTIHNFDEDEVIFEFYGYQTINEIVEILKQKIGIDDNIHFSARFYPNHIIIIVPHSYSFNNKYNYVNNKLWKGYFYYGAKRSLSELYMQKIKNL